MTGGLRDARDPKLEIVRIDDTNYVFNDKFKTMLRDNILDWSYFLEVYHDNIDNALLFDEIVKLLNVKDARNDDLRASMLPLVKQIYDLPPEAHVICMMKQYEIYEPISIAIHNLFNILKHHFENIIRVFIDERNKFLTENKHFTGKLNPSLDALLEEWQSINTLHELDSSSVALLFLNWPKKLVNVEQTADNTVQFALKFNAKAKQIARNNTRNNTPDADQNADESADQNTVLHAAEQLERAVSKFKYQGFCARVPRERLVALLTFPLNEFVLAINTMNPEIKFPNYKRIERLIEDEIVIKSASVKKPSAAINDVKIEREKFNKNIMQGSDTDAIKWHITKILEYRRDLLPIGKKYEEYYIAVARIVNSIANILQSELHDAK